MTTEVQAGLKIIKDNCSRGKVIVDANAGGFSVYVTLLVPKGEQEGLLEKVQATEPFKGKEQIYSIDVGDLPFWACRLNNFDARVTY